MAKGKKHVDTLFLELIYNLELVRDRLFFARFKLTPSHPRWGGLYLHLFFRGDADPDPHDHPWDFWTFPLQGYVEEIMDFNGGLYFNYVKPWRWTFRRAKHVHRVLPWRYRWCPKINLVWHKEVSQRWGFFVKPDTPHYYQSSSMFTRGPARKVHWRDYIYGEPYGEAEARQQEGPFVPWIGCTTERDCHLANRCRFDCPRNELKGLSDGTEKRKEG